MNMTGDNPIEGSESFPLDDALMVLSSRLRRAVIRELKADSPRSIEDLVDSVSYAGESEVEVSMHHNHIPRLEGYDVIEMSGDVILRGDNFEPAARYIEAIEEAR